MAAIVWQTPANPPEPEDYIFFKGKRYVRPYYFEFISHVKNRWAGKTIVDLFTEEFRGRPYEYYESAVKSGRIQVDDKIVSVSYIVRSTQKISHFVHRHEPPVLAGNVSILHSEPDVITVCKPASIPVHPCGQYRKNTIVGILQAEHGVAPLFPIHRLDRLVSGLLIFARNAGKAEQFRQQVTRPYCYYKSDDVI
ncbi:RNA pseudouridine synthase 7-like [Dendrobium catenatum]|uniref:RNA pseudouridine synthase 7-like n=1 Tax=Dendrobium catenatum TaxID=906689 RepID=UPI0009F1A656|nr:RNA pseudouridine synthase 7-like [Dendrobium catenatum]